MKNKKGEEKLFSIWWFLVLLIVGASVSYMTVASSSISQDIRHLEAGILYTQVENCIIKDNILNTKIFEEDFDFYSECDINKDVLNKNFYIGINLFFEEDLVNSTNFGKNYKEECNFFLNGIEAPNYPRCILVDEKIFYFEDGVKKGGVLEIVAGSNNDGKRIPQK